MIASMLRTNSDRVLTHTAFDFEPSLEYMSKTAHAAAVINGRLKSTNWAVAQSAFLLRYTKERILVNCHAARFATQSLGLESWYQKHQDFGDALREGLSSIGVANIKRAGFKVQAFIPVKLSQAEIVDLLLRNFLVQAKFFAPICESPSDVLFQVHGQVDGLKVIVIISGMSADQAKQQFAQVPNLEQFLTEKYLDTALVDFARRINDDCLYVDVDAFSDEEGMRIDTICPFLQNSFGVAEKVTEAVVSRILGVGKKDN